jgi:hypothetical protein
MAERNIILDQEIPYEQFMLLGFNRKSIFELPKEVLDPLYSGEVTPILQSRIQTANGNVYNVPMKLQLVRDANRQVQLMALPLRKEIYNTLHLKPGELEQVAQGEVIRKEILGKDGTRRRKYIQLDTESKSLIYRDAAAVQVASKLKDLEKIKDIELGTNQKQAAQEGKPVELNVGQEKVTVGVDLHEPQGFKVVNGDMEEWKRQSAIRYDREHPEYMGYVQTDENRWEYRQLQLQYQSNRLIEEPRKDQKSNGLKL